MKRGLVLAIIIFLVACIKVSVMASLTEATEIQTVDWNTEEGIDRLKRCKNKQNLWSLVRFYESQIHPAFCGIASLVMALNSLSVTPPEGQNIYMQHVFFTDEVKAVINPEEIKQVGMSLNDLASILPLFPINFTKYPATEFSHEELRKILISALDNPKQCVLTLFWRPTLGQEGKGHWSPIAAYDVISDSFLILDVLRYKYSPYWVKAATLLNAMQTKNKSGNSRGFILIEYLQ